MNRQGTTSFDSRTSFDHSSKHQETCGGGTYNESCRSEIDFRVQGLLHSAVEEHDHIRKKAVQMLIHQFEMHPNEEALQADLNQNHAFNPFSEQSKDVIYSMGNMEYFEICEFTPKVQCFDCMTCWTQGIEYCTCGTCLRLRCSVDSQLRHQERPIPGSTPREQRGKESSTQPMAKEKEYKSMLDRFLNSPCLDNHKSTLDGPKNTSHAWMRLRPKITPISLLRQSAPDVKLLGSLCSTAQVRTAP